MAAGGACGPTAEADRAAILVFRASTPLRAAPAASPWRSRPGGPRDSVGRKPMGTSPSPMKCPRRETDLGYVGTRAFHAGTRRGFLGELGGLFANRERFDVSVRRGGVPSPHVNHPQARRRLPALKQTPERGPVPPEPPG